MSNQIRRELEKIEIPNELQERARLGIRAAKTEQPKRKWSKRVAIPLVASLFMMFSVGVAATTMPTFSKILSYVSPEIALMLYPVERVSEDNGIRMEVAAAWNDSEMAVIYVTMQDLTGDRVDDTLDLYNYSLTGAQMFHSQLVDYDEKTKTATLRIQANGGENLNNSKVNFRIDSFLSDKQTMDGVIVQENLSELIKQTPQTVSLDMNNIPGGGGRLFEEYAQQGHIQVLKPNEQSIPIPTIDFMHISNIGIIDNRLHIQVQWNGENIDDNGYFYFEDNRGDKVTPTNMSFGIDENGKTVYGREYSEYIFELNEMDIDNHPLLGYFVSNGNYITGNWSTTFKLEPVVEEINKDFHMEFPTWNTNRVAITPLGITLYGNGKFEHSYSMNVSVQMNDGTILALDGMTSFSNNDEVIVKLVASKPIDVENIKGMNINGSTIPIE